MYELDRNIEAGAKFMRFMEAQYFESEPMDKVTKSLFATASYNAGAAKIQTLRKEAAKNGYNPNLWFNNAEIFASVGQDWSRHLFESTHDGAYFS